jgi:hypothetical protein
VVAGNALYLLHIFNPNPLNLYSGLAAITHPGILAGLPSADPNSGITAQALGHLAAEDWLHGHVPWWNPFEGLGAPLAGEMQSAALFPLTILLAFSGGQVYLHLLLELIAGFSAYLLLHELRVGRTAATGGAVAFALCGTFAWFSHAPENPVAFLPMLLLGLEYAARDGHPKSCRGWVTIAVAIALSLYAGFPEMAYIDGVFAAVWAVARLIEVGPARRRRFIRTTAVGAGVGALLSAPIVVAFADYLPSANLGAHSGLFGGVSLPGPALSQLFLPYVYGPIDAFSSYDHSGTLSSIWGNVGGYLTASLLMLGLVGLYGRRRRLLRLAVALWLLVALGRTFGVPVLSALVNALPGMRDVAFYRYSPPTWTLALVVLATLGTHDLLQHRVPRWWIGVCGALSALAVALSVLRARVLWHELVGAADHRAWAVASVLWALGTIGTIGGAALFLRGRVRAGVMMSVLAFDALAMFVIPQLSAPRSATLYPAPVEYLTTHLGTSRFYTVGPIPANYGSYFGTASLNSNDVPEPKRYDSYLTDQLHLSVGSGPPASVAAATFMAHLTAFEDSGVKYLLTPSGFSLPVAPDGAHLKLVFSGPSADIYRVPSPGSLYKVGGPGCTVLADSLSKATVTCSSPRTLTRRELYMRGWSATVNGGAVSLEAHGDFQQVRLAAGRSTVVFSFTPPFMGPALVAFLAGLLLIAAGVVSRSRRRSPTWRRCAPLSAPSASAPHPPARRRAART